MLTSNPNPEWTLGSDSVESKQTIQGIYGAGMNAFGQVGVKTWTSRKLYHSVTRKDCIGNTGDRGDYSSLHFVQLSYN